MEAEMREVVEAEMRYVMEAEMRKVVEAEIWDIMEAERSATLDSLSPMHAETEGKEPSPSVQLCKLKKIRNMNKESDTNTTRDEKEIWKCGTEEECSCLVPDTACLV